MMYNQTVDKYNKRQNDCKDSWMEYAKQILSEHSEDYVKEVPYQIKRMAIKDCYLSWISNCRKTRKTGHPFSLRFRTRKNPKQSCYIPKSAVKESGIYYTMAGKLKYAEMEFFKNEIQDCRIIMEYGKWFLLVPFKTVTTIPSENQGGAVAIDPGIRSFATYFSTDGRFGHIGNGSFQRILRINLKIDKLISKLSLEKMKKRKRNLYRKICILRYRLKCLVDELQWKAIKWFTENFSVIIFPPFNVKDMVHGNKLPKVVKRSMLSFNFYRFKERLKECCSYHGIRFIEQDESYTSRTNSFTGELINIGSKEYFKYDGITVNRDINGARNILLRSMRDSSVCICNVAGCLVS